MPKRFSKKVSDVDPNQKTTADNSINKQETDRQGSLTMKNKEIIKQAREQIKANDRAGIRQTVAIMNAQTTRKHNQKKTGRFGI